MLEHEAIKELERIKEKLEEKPSGYDEENAHIEADEVLEEYLWSNGYEGIVKAFRQIPKWYA